MAPKTLSTVPATSRTGAATAMKLRKAVRVVLTPSPTASAPSAPAANPSAAAPTPKSAASAAVNNSGNSAASSLGSAASRSVLASSLAFRSSLNFLLISWSLWFMDSCSLSMLSFASLAFRSSASWSNFWSLSLAFCSAFILSSDSFILL